MLTAFVNPSLCARSFTNICFILPWFLTVIYVVTISHIPYLKAQLLSPYIYVRRLVIEKCMYVYSLAQNLPYFITYFYGKMKTQE
jgi:hypothetical protein